MEAGMIHGHKLGCRPDETDKRDRKYHVELRPQNRLFKAISRPSAKYLKELNLPRLYNQYDIGSCVGHGVVQAAAYALDFNASRLDGLKPNDYSRLFAYYNARQNKLADEGATIRDGIRAVAQHGLCREDLWPYDTKKWAEKPPPVAYAEAAHRRAVLYYRITRLGDALDCIAQGYPIVFGMMLFDSFNAVGKDGIVSMPDERNEEPLGGHCMLMVGYSMKQRRFFVRNSWGQGWGYGGYCWVPFDYVEKYASDLWTIRAMNGVA